MLAYEDFEWPKTVDVLRDNNYVINYTGPEIYYGIKTSLKHGEYSVRSDGILVRKKIKES